MAAAPGSCPLAALLHPWRAEVRSAKSSVNEASFTGQTQERFFRKCRSGFSAVRGRRRIFFIIM
jgi:hypothetical protein